MEAERSSDTYLNFYQATRRNVLEGNIIYSQRIEIGKWKLNEFTRDKR